MGIALFLQAISELPVMFGFSWLLTKAGSRVWTRLSGVGFFLHAFGSWLAPTIGVLCAVQIFEMNGYALFAIASIYYINETVAEDRRGSPGSPWPRRWAASSPASSAGVCWTWPASPPCWAWPP